jgi:signal transduction histidine kinase
VSYEQVRTAARISRALLGLALLGLALVGWAHGSVGYPVKAAAAGLLVLHAVLDFPRRSALAGLTADSLLFCAAAGIGLEVKGPLAAVLAYLLAAAILLLPSRQVVVVVTALAVGVTLRLAVWSPPEGIASHFEQAAAWLESGIYLIALGLLVLGAARAVRLGRASQAEALEAEKRAAAIKNDFVSMVSHELRTPLTNISGFAMTLRESWRTFDPAEVDEFLDVVCREADHLRSLVDDVLVVPRSGAGRLRLEPTEFSLGPAVYRMATLTFPPGGHKSVSVSVSGAAVVRADPNRVEQVLRNLLENAARYGGSQVSIEATPLGAEWEVTVADDGPGVDPGFRERLFTPFEQAEAGLALGRGLGLGLTVCRTLVEAMGGRIWHEPRFPTGARFCFTLPAASSRQGAALPV